jgi:hypothetical protein
LPAPVTIATWPSSPYDKSLSIMYFLPLFRI